MAENIQRVILTADDETKAAFASFRANVKGATDSTDTLTKASTKLKGGLAALGVTLSAAFFTDLVKRSNEFGKSLAQISTQIDGSGDDLRRLEASAKSLSVQFGTAPVEQARAFYEIISAGIDDTTQATELLGAANKLAIGGITDLATATDGLTNIMNSYSGKVESAGAVSDALFIAMKAGKATMEELSSGLGKVTPLASALDISFDELVATIAALSKQGIQTRESITGVRAILASIAKPASQATELAHQLGLEFNAAALQGKGFAAFMQDVIDKTGGSTDKLALLFGGVESLVPVMALAGQAGDDFNQIMTDMTGKAGATQEAFDRMAASPGFKFDQLMALFSNGAIALGDTLANVLIPIVEKVTAAFSGLFAAELSPIEKQKALIIDLRDELESMANRKNIPLIGDLIFDKREADLLSQRLEDAIDDLARLEAATNTEIVTVRKEAVALQEVTKVIAPTVKAKKAAVSESRKFIGALNKEAAQLGKTSSEIRKMEAATLGLSDQADPLIDEIDAQTVAARKLEAQLSRVKQITESVMTADERFAQTQAELNDLLGIKGGLSVETYNRALKEAQGQLDATDVKARQTFDAMDQYAIAAARGMQSAFADFLFDPFDGGLGNLFKNFANTLRRMVAEIAASGLLRHAAGAFGLGASGSAFAGSGGFGLDIGSIGSLASNAFSTGFGTTSLLGKGASLLGETFGSAALSSFGSGLAGTGAGVFSAAGGAGTAFIGGTGTAIGGSGLGAAAGAGALASTALAGLGAGAAGVAVGSLLAGDKKVLGLSGTTTSTIGAALGFAAGGPIGAAIGGVLGGGINALFGHGPLKFRQQSLQGNVSADGFDGDITNVFRAKGGVFSSNKHKSQSEDISLELQAKLDDTLSGFFLSTNAFAKNMGLNTSFLDTYSKEIQIKSEKNEQLTEQAIDSMLAGIGEEIARGTLPAVDSLRKAGEISFTTLARLSTEFDVLSNAANVLGLSLTDSRNTILGLSIEQRTAIVDAAGGAENLNNQIGFFATNFLSAEEQFNLAFASMDKQMSALGLSANMSRDEFKALVMSVTEVGGISVETAAALLNIQAPFLAVKNAQDNLTDSSGTLTDAQIKLKDAIAGAAVEEEKRIRKMEATEATRLNNINSALGEVDGAFNVLQRSIDANKKTITDDYNTALASQNATIQQFADSIANLTSLSGALKSTIESINPLSLDAARRQIQAAIVSKDLDANNLKRAIAALSQSDSTGFATELEFQRSQAKNLRLLNELGSVTDSQLTLEKRTLAALETARDRLTDGFNSEIARLDAVLGSARDQLDVMKGIDVSVLSVVDAVNNLQIKLNQAAIAQAVPSQQSAIDAARSVQANQNSPISLPSHSSGATVSPISDAQIRDFAATHTPQEIRDAAVANGIDSSRLASALGTSKTDILRIAKENNLASFDVGGRVPKTGLALIHKNEQILTEKDSNSLSHRIENVVAELRKMNATLAEVAKKTKDTADTLDNATNGNLALKTRT